MKRARRMLAVMAYVTVWVAFLPFAFAHWFLEAVMLGVFLGPMLDSLEGIIHE
jgi:hypothetical protein